MQLLIIAQNMLCSLRRVLHMIALDPLEVRLPTQRRCLPQHPHLQKFEVSRYCRRQLADQTLHDIAMGARMTPLRMMAGMM